MRAPSSALVMSLILLASVACDNKQESTSSTTAASATAATAAAVSATASAAPTPKPPMSAMMPERPVPKPETMVSSSAPIEVQQKAIAYSMAMRAPHPDDANAEPEYAKELANKLKPISLSMDNGPDKGRMNRTDVIASGRQIDLLMSSGCNEKTAIGAVVQRAGVPLATLASHGVFVVRCNDARIQCFQSTRDPEDVLCTTAPRHH
jgi:hypothetical protein